MKPLNLRANGGKTLFLRNNVMKPLNLRANRGKTPNTTLGQQFPWQVPSGPHATFLQPYPRYREKIRWVSIFFLQKSKTCQETIEFTSQWGQNTKKYSCATMPEAIVFTPTCNISSDLAPLSRKNSLNQHFFIQKNKNLWWNRWIYEPMGAKHQKLLLGNNARGKCLHAHMQHFFSPSPAIEKKFAESAFFHTKKLKLVMQPLNLRANGGKTPKTIPGQQCPWQVPSRPHTTFLQP